MLGGDIMEAPRVFVAKEELVLRTTRGVGVIVVTFYCERADEEARSTIDARAKRF